MHSGVCLFRFLSVLQYCGNSRVGIEHRYFWWTMELSNLRTFCLTRMPSIIARIRRYLSSWWIVKESNLRAGRRLVSSTIPSWESNPNTLHLRPEFLVECDGFEPPCPFGEEIYSLPHSTALPTLRYIIFENTSPLSLGIKTPLMFVICLTTRLFRGKVAPRSALKYGITPHQQH